MDAENRTAGDNLKADLRARAGEYDFFQAVRRIDAAREDPSPSARIGSAEDPSKEPVRFCQQPSLWFSGQPVEKFEDGGPDSRGRLFVNFMGMLGPNGPMPLHVSEFAHDREHNYKDSTTARFFDMFNHRMVGMFYRAWAANQMAVSRDRGGDDSYTRFVGSLIGMGMESFQGRDAVPFDAKLFYAGRLSSSTMNPEGLEAVLRDFFGVPVKVEEFAGRWMDLPAECMLRLGESPETGTLGRTAVMGSRFWDCTQTFRIRIGPMSLRDYERLLPGGLSIRRLVDWVRHYTTDSFFWDMRLVLLEKEVPRVEMGRVGRLGWTSWVLSRPAGRDADDLRIDPGSLHGVTSPREEDMARELVWAARQAESAAYPPEEAAPAPAKAAPAPEAPAPAAGAPAPEPGPGEGEEEPGGESGGIRLEEMEPAEEGIIEAGEEDLLTIDVGIAPAEEAGDGLSDPSLGPEEELPQDLERLVDRTLMKLDWIDPGQAKKEPGKGTDSGRAGQAAGGV